MSFVTLLHANIHNENNSSEDLYMRFLLKNALGQS